MSSGSSLTLWGESASLALVGHTSSDGVMIKMPYGVYVLHWPSLHTIRKQLHNKESKKLAFIFSIELRTKFVWSYGLLLSISECYFCIRLKIGFWNFKQTFLRMQFSLVVTYFLYFWLSIWVEIRILNFFMSFQHLYHLTFGDKSVRVLDFHIWN